MSRLWLARHGETEWSRDGRHTGTSDIPLTEAGRREAELLKGPLGSRFFARVLSSPLLRATETCRLAGLGDQMEVADDLVEWDYGEYEGVTTKQIHETDPEWSLWRDGGPGGESLAEVGARADRVLAEVAGLEGEVALFSHGHFLRVLGARWVDLEPAEGSRLYLGTGTLCLLGHEHETTRVLSSWNAPVDGDIGAPPPH